LPRPQPGEGEQHSAHHRGGQANGLEGRTIHALSLRGRPAILRGAAGSRCDEVAVSRRRRRSRAGIRWPLDSA
jgi:hypothetical protein